VRILFQQYDPYHTVCLGHNEIADLSPKASRNYYADLYEAEKNGDRWIGENDSVFVLTTFAPRGFNEVRVPFELPFLFVAIAI